MLPMQELIMFMFVFNKFKKDTMGIQIKYLCVVYFDQRLLYIVVESWVFLIRDPS